MFQNYFYQTVEKKAHIALRHISFRPPAVTHCQTLTYCSVIILIKFKISSYGPNPIKKKETAAFMAIYMNSDPHNIIIINAAGKIR